MKHKSAHEPKAKVMSPADVWDDARQVADVLHRNLLKVDVFVRSLESYPVWSPHESFEAANVLLDALKADRQKP